jgi:O-antigen/teichoic acid export membrane protein
MNIFKSRRLVQRNSYFDVAHIKTDLKNKAFQGATGAVFSQVSVYLIQMVGVIVLARLLTPEDFGLVAMVTAIDVFVRMFRNLGLMDAIVQREEINHKQVSTLFWINAAFGLSLTLFFMSMAPLIAWFYREPRLVLIAVLISLDYVFGGISTQHRALLKRSLQMYRWAANEIAATTIGFGTAIILAWQGWGYWAIVARVIAFAVAQAVGSWLFCQWRPGLPAWGTGIRPMLLFGRDMLGNNFLNFVSESFDKILIGRFQGAQALGHYSRAYHLFLAPAQQLTVPLTSVAVATLSRLQNEPEKYRRYFMNAITMVAFVGFPISGMLTIMGKDIVSLLLGPQWDIAGRIFCVFGVGIGIHILYATNMWLHMSIGRTDRLLRWSVIGSIAISISFLIGLPFGPLGMAAAYTVMIHLLIGPCLWYAGKPMQIELSSIFSIIWKYYLSALFAGLICWLVLYLYGPVSAIFVSLNVFLKIILASILYALLYLILVSIFYQSVSPILQFYNIVRDMLPKTKRS